MADESNRIHISEESELAALIQESAASGRPLQIETNGTVYTGSFVEGTRTGKRPIDPEKVARLQASIRAATGAWKDFDAEGFKEYIRERRRTANRPPVEL